jgi:hypothetical protein
MALVISCYQNPTPLQTQTELIQKYDFSSQSQRRIARWTSHSGMLPDDSVNDSLDSG